MKCDVFAPCALGAIRRDGALFARSAAPRRHERFAELSFKHVVHQEHRRDRVRARSYVGARLRVADAPRGAVDIARIVEPQYSMA